jgi:hypothetical protein
MFTLMIVPFSLNWDENIYFPQPATLRTCGEKCVANISHGFGSAVWVGAQESVRQGLGPLHPLHKPYCLLVEPIRESD